MYRIFPRKEKTLRLSALNTGFRHLLAVACLVFLPSILMAQESGEENEEVFDLSPFEVSGDSDIGYSASQTTLGTRFNTQIKDVASQVEVFTEEFMEDLNVTSIEDAFRYSVSVENSEDFISPNDGGFTATWTGKTVGRVRGIFPAQFSTSRNLFSSITTADGYNISRISIGYGAQSLFFSLGEPAGVANITLKAAEMRNFMTYEGSVTSEDGHRFRADINQEIIDDKLAFRFAYLNENQPRWIKPSYDRNERFYGTFTYKPFSKTSIRVHAETTDRSYNLPFTHFPWDFASAAYEDGQILPLDDIPWTLYKHRGLIWNIGNYEGPNEIYGLFFQRRLAGPGSLPFWPEKYGQARDPNTGVGRITFSPERLAQFPDVADNLHDSMFGENFKNDITSDIYNVFIEQKILDGLILEIAGHKEDWTRETKALAQYWSAGYDIDLHEYLPLDPYEGDVRFFPDETTEGYVPNPNYGKLFVDSQGYGDLAEEETEEYRAQLVWKPELPDFLDWAGEHTFIGSFNHRESQYIAIQMNLKIVNEAIDINGLTGSSPTNQQRLIRFRHYFDSGVNASFQPPLPGVGLDEWFSGLTFTDPVTGQELTLSTWGDPGVGNSPRANRSAIKSYIAGWQGRFFRDRLLLNYGFRRDDAWQDGIDIRSKVDGEVGPNHELIDYYGREFIVPVWHDDVVFDVENRFASVEDSHTFGIVGRPLRWLSVSYYESNTVNLPSGWYTPFGDPIQGTNGYSKDYAIRIDSPDNKSYLKFNVYEVKQNDNNVGLGTVRIQALRLEQAYREEVNRGDPGGVDKELERYYSVIREQQGDSPNAINGQFELTDSRYPVIGDKESKGFEITAGTQWKGWNLRFTFSKNETIKTSTGSEWQEWLSSRVPYYEEFRNEDGEDWSQFPYDGPHPERFNILNPDGTARSMTMKEFYELVTLPTFDLAAEQNNTPIDTSRKYRAALVVSHNFGDGTLEGLRLGSVVRWRSAPIIGFAVKDSDRMNGDYPVPTLDLTKPYYGEEELNFEFFASYPIRAKFFGKNVIYRVQLNVLNAFTDKGDHYTGRVNAFGESAFEVFKTPRRFTLQLTAQF